MIAAAIPIAAPTSGPAVCPDALAAVHRKSVGLKPLTADGKERGQRERPAPIAAARSTSPRRGADRVGRGSGASRRSSR